ncbi:protein-cysteine N-palmitoyltransferase Rasp [Copidosoma floridanum]|uniref:protein-cysteine N-palmitoyltransferase Rasp n=1 Tax=Copidosoma floridanum TaxID=29053 RepID=UPI0006C93F51|nr:protein-cysteine N-palmitoyltransferase Rasp [Copidosoma floridanum]
MEPKKSQVKFETLFYFGVWIAAVLYSIYRVYLATDKFFYNYYDAYNDFSPGWSFLNRKLDSSDEEWKMWIPLIYRLVPWIIVHIIMSQCIKHFHHNTTLLCGWYVTISITFLWHYLGFLSTLCTLLLPFVSCLLTSLESKTVSWLVHSITLALIYWAKVSDIVFREWLDLNDEDYFLLTTAICWIQLRSISYSLDSINSYKHIHVYGFFKDLIQNIAYCLYLPTLFLGPIILYHQFTDGIRKPFTRWGKEKLQRTILNLVRYTFWMYFTELSLHFLYFNALRFHPEAVIKLEPWEFYGFGYCMGQYFLNKYVVTYGLTSTVCRAEDIDAPPQPKCIGRIHLYSDMWKHFDRGLYKFLLRYIYIPCSPRTSFRKIFASALCFIFIYLWHGMHLYIFIWSFLNFTGVLIENIAKSSSKYLYKNILHDSLNDINKRRLECLFATPLLILSAISNFYFFADEEIGHIYMRKIFQETWKVYVMLLFALYCCCQTSTEIKKMEEYSVKTRKPLKLKQ